MKPLNLFGFTLLFLLANVQILNAQCTQDITLSSQAAVDSFSVTYGCDIIEGTLTISGDDITNLNGLSAITKITFLKIENNPLLKNLEGLEDIREICKKLTINNNSNLLNIDAISAKKTYVESLIIKNNDALSHLPDFENVQPYLDIIIENNFALKTILIEGVTLNDDLLISENTSLTSILIKDTYLDCGSFRINDNPNLTDIKTTGRLFTEICTAKIYNNNSLKNASIYMGQSSGLEVYDNPVLEKLRYIFFNGDVFISNNPALNDISMAGYLMYNLDIISNQSLENIGYFDVDEVSRLNISDNPNLKNIDSLFNIEKITSNIKITNNSNLANCCLLPEWLDRTGVESENVNISQNKEGCNGIVDIETSCNEVIDCDTEEPVILTTQADVDKLTCEVINGDLIIDSENVNDPVTDLSALSGLTTIKGSLYIRNCYIENLNGLNAIINIKSLTIENNPQLQNLDGLENLENIGSQEVDYGENDIIIRNNTNLLNIDAISASNGYVYEIVIDNNSALNQLPDFENFPSHNKIQIINNSTLQNIEISSNYYHNGGIYIFGNTGLNSISLNNVIVEYGNLDVYDNVSLTDIQISDFIAFDSYVTIDDNNSLKNISAQIKISCAGLSFRNNPVLENFNGEFFNANNFKYLTLSNNAAITNVNIAGNRIEKLSIDSNQSLENIDNIDIDEVGSLTISDNPNLKNIDSLFNLENITSSINITNNSNLANCCLLPEWLDRIGAKSEKVDISQNKEGCNSIVDIETSCAQPNFEDFPWLNDIVDLNNCCNNQTVTQYTNGVHSYIYIETSNNCQNTKNRLYYKGQLFCNVENDFCVDAYNLQNFEAITLWSCEEKPVECMANAGSVVANNNDLCEGNSLFEPATVFEATENEAYDYLFLLTNEDGNILEVNFTGQFAMRDSNDNYFAADYYCVYGVSYLAVEGIDWRAGNINQLTNQLGTSLEDGACFAISDCENYRYWANPVVNEISTSCNENETFTVELNVSSATWNSFEIQYGENAENRLRVDAGETFSLTLSANSLTHSVFVYDKSDARCETVYEVKTPKECNENLPNFEDFPWLEDKVDLNDCCNNQTVTQYSNGVHSYIYIEASNNCENAKNRLYYNGELFCNVENDFCFDAYNLQNFEATTLWSYEEECIPDHEETKPNFEDFPWLEDKVDLNDCCNNQTVTQYSNGVHSYIYIEASNNCQNTKNRLYYNGELFCNVENDFCFDAYNFQNFEATTLWSCEEDNSQKTAINNTILNNFNETIAQSAKIKVYPNPAQEMLSIETTGLNVENLQVNVVDYMGKTVQSIKPKTEVIKLEISNLKAGNYIIYINDGLQTIVEKFVKID